MKHRLLAGAAVVATLFAAPAFAQTVAQHAHATGGSRATEVDLTIPAVAANQPLVVGFVYCKAGTNCSAGNLLPSGNTITVTDTAGNTFTVQNGQLATAFPTTASGSDTFKVVFSPAVDYPAVDVSQLAPPSGFHFTGAVEGAVVAPVTSTSPLTLSNTTANAEDLLYSITFAGSSGVGAGQTQVFYGSGTGLRDSHKMVTTAGAQTMSYPITSATGGAMLALEAVSTAPPVPKSASCSPASPSLLDTAASGAAVCALGVVTSDNSAYTGTNTFSPAAEFVGPATGNGNITLARKLSPSDDGAQTVAVSMTENGPPNIPGATHQ